MADQPISSEPYGFQYSVAGSDSRKQLPPEVRMVLQDVLDVLAANLDAFPGRMRSLTRDGNVRLYSHPSPALQVTFQVGPIAGFCACCMSWRREFRSPNLYSSATAIRTRHGSRNSGCSCGRLKTRN